MEGEILGRRKEERKIGHYGGMEKQRGRETKNEDCCG